MSMNEPDNGLYEDPVFIDPPGEPRRDGLRRVLEKIATRPDHWARIADYATKKTAQETASRIRTGVRGVLPGVRWESCVRKVENGRWGVWVQALDNGDAFPEGPEEAR